jgi:hypothetical protein
MKSVLVEKKRDWREPWPEELPDVLLRKGLRLSLPNPRGEERNGEDSREEISCEVLDWSLVWHGGNGGTELLIEVHEVRKPWFSRLSEDHQSTLVVTSVVLSLFAAALLGGAIYYFPQPTFFWSFVGHYIRGMVGWGLVGLGIGLSWRTGAYSGQATFSRHYLAFLITVLGMIAGLVWSQMALRPEGLSGSPERDIRYLEYLMSRARTTWPVVAGLLPWLALGLEALGFGIASKVTGAFGRKGDKSKS